MEKQLIIKQKNFIFNFREENNFWYLGKNEFDIFNLGYFSDITINIANPNWEEIEDFLYYLLKDSKEIHHKLKISNVKLTKVFREHFYNIVPDFKFEDLIFTLCNIEYLEKNKFKNEFKYILNFNAESKSDVDFFTYDSWNTLFEGGILVDAYKS